MSGDYKDKLLKYITGKLSLVEGTNEPQFSSVTSSANNLYEYLLTEFPDGYFINDILQSGTSATNTTSTTTVYGYWLDGVTAKGFILILNTNFEVISKQTQYKSGTDFGVFKTLAIADDGTYFGIDNNLGTTRFILLNNFTVKLDLNADYEVILRKSYNLPANISTADNYAGALKCPGKAFYLIYGSIVASGTPQPIATELKINVGTPNEWTEYRYGSNVTFYPFDAYASWDGSDVITFKVGGFDDTGTNQLAYVEYSRSATVLSRVQYGSSFNTPDKVDSKIVNLTTSYLSVTISSGSVQSNYIYSADIGTNSITLLYTKTATLIPGDSTLGITLNKQINEMYFRVVTSDTVTPDLYKYYVGKIIDNNTYETYLGEYSATQTIVIDAYYTFDTNSNAQLGGINGVDTNITYASAKFSNGAVLNGTTSKIVLADNPIFRPTGSYTIGFWYKTVSVAGAPVVFQSTSSLGGIEFYIGASGNIFAFIKSQDGTYANPGSLASIADGLWHYIVLTYDHNALQCKLYVDGVLQSTKACKDAYFGATNYVRIGCSNPNGTDSRFANGTFDDLFIINGEALYGTYIASKYAEDTAQGTGDIVLSSTINLNLFYVQKQFNLYIYYIQINNTVNYVYQIYNSINYNGLPFESGDCLVPNSSILYNPSDVVIFARNLYNVSIANNTTTSTVEIPNLFLNDETIATECLLGKTNVEMVCNTENFTKNIFELVLINFINTLIMTNNNNILAPVINTVGAIKLNQSSSTVGEYDNAKALKLKIVYDDILIPDEYMDILPDNITIALGVATVNIYLYILLGKKIDTLTIMSNDQTTSYVTIIGSSMLENNFYHIIQEVEVV